MKHNRRQRRHRHLIADATLALTLLGLACTVGSSSGDLAEETGDDDALGWIPKENADKGPHELDATLNAGEVPSVSSLDLRSFLAGHDLAWSLRDCETTLCVSSHAATWSGFDRAATPRYYLLAGLHVPQAVIQTPAVQHLIFVVSLGAEQGTAEQRDIQATLQAALAKMPPQDLVSLVAARTDAEILVETVAPDSLALNTSIADYIGSTSTNAYDGLRRAYEVAQRQLAGNPEAVPRIVLITDGKVSAGLADLQRIENLAAAQGRSGVGLSAFGIGVGDSLALTLVHALAQAGGGRWRWLDDGPSLTLALQEEISQRWSRGAARAALTLRTAGDVSIVAVHGARINQMQSHEASVEFTMPHAQGGHELGIATAIFELRPDSSGATSIGELTLEYPESSSKLVTSITPVNFAGMVLPREGEPLFADETSQRAFVALETFFAFERVALATELAGLDQGLIEVDTVALRLQSWLDAMNFAVPGEFARDAIRAAQMRANLEDQLPH